MKAYYRHGLAVSGSLVANQSIKRLRLCWGTSLPSCKGSPYFVQSAEVQGGCPLSGHEVHQIHIIELQNVSPARSTEWQNDSVDLDSLILYLMKQAQNVK